MKKTEVEVEAGWRFVCLPADGPRYDLDPGALDRRLQAGLRSGAWDAQRFLDEVARFYGVTAEAYYGGRLVLSSRCRTRAPGSGKGRTAG